MSAHVLLNFLNKVKKRDKCEAAKHLTCISFSQRVLSIQQYKSMNVRFYLSYDVKITLKSHFCRKKTL